MNAIVPTLNPRSWRRLAVTGFAVGLGLTGLAQTPGVNHLPGLGGPGAFSGNNPIAAPAGDDFDLGRFPHSDYSSYIQPRPQPIYFPPTAPRLDEHVDLPSMFEARKPAPAELAAFVNEPFYAPLSTRLSENTLSAKQRQRLDAYLVAKLRLQNELRSRLADLVGADSAVRQREYAVLARTEDPQIGELEQAAQQLRVDLVRGGLFQLNVDWSNSREWRLGSTRFRSAIDAMAAQFQVMRSAGFYQNGFVPAQRRLLFEVSMELGAMPVRNPDSPEAEPADGSTPTDTNPPLFFSPETSRIHLPVDLPQDLADKVAKYEQDKSQLKKELRDSVYQEDGAYFGFVRTHASAVLAQQQQLRITALENLAEEIRRGLANLPHQPHPPEPPAIPPALADRITTFLHDKASMQKDLVALLLDARRTLDIQRVGYSKTKEGKYVLNLAIRPFDRNEVQMKKLQENFAAFNQVAAGRSAALARDLTAIRGDVGSFIGAGAGVAAEKAIDRFLAECAETLEAREDWELYRDYRIAVLEPGLSPPQRRLLYDAALVDLGLPLPGLEYGPVESSANRRPFYNAGQDRFPSMASSPGMP